MNVRQVYPKRFGPSVLTTSYATYFTADRRYAIERFTITNTSAATVKATISLVSSGGTASASNCLICSMDVPAYDVTTVPLPVVLSVGDTIQAKADASSSMNLTFNVNEIEMSIQ